MHFLQKQITERHARSKNQWLYLYLENEGEFNALRQSCSRIWEVSVFFQLFEYLYTVH
jgi:hypothetical protein